MQGFRSLLLVTCLVTACFAFAPSASGAEICTNVVTSLPVVITRPGVWCLERDLSTAMASGFAIEIRTSHVTVDCNGFRLNGPGGKDATTTGVYAYGRLSYITVRNCLIRGFRSGIAIYGNDPGIGHRVEDNRIANTGQGIYVIGHGSIAQRNHVMNTRVGPGATYVYAMSVLGDVIDNVVDGVSAPASVENFTAGGIYSGGVGGTPGDGFLVRGNRVRNLEPKGTGEAQGIITAGTGIVVRDNVIVQPSLTTGKGVYCSIQAHLKDNVIRNFTQNWSSCHDAGGNVAF